mgnify:FL=1
MPLLPVSELEQAAPVFRGKAGNAFAKMLLGAFGMTEVERVYTAVEGKSGHEAASAILSEVGVSYSLIGEENLKGLGDGPFITISNHPIGSLDGIILVDCMAKLRPDYKIIVNKVLSRVKVLESNFISVTPTGETRTAPTAESISGIREAMRHVKDGHPLGLFPSGAVSDKILGPRPTVKMPDGSSYVEPRIRDREWQMPIVRFIEKVNVPVIPIRFFDGNTDFYYNLGAYLGWKVRLLRFPREMTNKRGKTIRLGVGPVITPERQKQCADTEELRTLLRGSVYGQNLPG